MGFLLEALRSVEFLDGMEPALATRFSTLGRSADHPKNHVFWRAGAPPNALVVAVSGEAKTSTRDAEGRQLIDRFLGCGDCMGLASAIDGLPHATDALVSRAGEFFVVSRVALLRFLDEQPAARANAAKMIGTLYRRALKQREDMALRPVPQRVAEFLLRHGCTREADGARVLVSANQAQIAAHLGSVREVVSRTIADFANRGLVARRDEGVLILDWDGLAAEANLGCGESTTDRLADPTHRARTQRFFLPRTEHRRRLERAEDAESCRDRLGDLALCRARGCPLALEDRAHRPLSAPARLLVGRESRAAAALLRA